MPSFLYLFVLAFVRFPICLSVCCVQGEAVSNHPNQWFQASLLYHKAKAAGSVRTAVGAGDMLSPVVQKEETDDL